MGNLHSPRRFRSARQGELGKSSGWYRLRNNESNARQARARSSHDSRHCASRKAALVINGDNPITSRVQDRLDRAPFADQVATALRTAPAPRGLVLALIGPQGVGKTS